MMVMITMETFNDNERGCDDVSDDVTSDALVSAVIVGGQPGHRQVAGLL